MQILKTVFDQEIPSTYLGCITTKNGVTPLNIKNIHLLFSTENHVGDLNKTDLHRCALLYTNIFQLKSQLHPLVKDFYQLFGLLTTFSL